MPTHRQLVVDVPTTTRGNGSADTASMQNAFPGSPVYKGELNDEVVKNQFQTLVIDGEVDDGGHTFGVFNRDYPDAPNLEEVEVGGGGLPGSPYAPNIAVPEVGQNPADIPASGVEATNAARGSGGAFSGNGLASPNDTSVNIARQRIGTLMFGNSEPTS